MEDRWAAPCQRHRAPPPISAAAAAAACLHGVGAAPTHLTMCKPSISLCEVCPSVALGVLKKHNAIRALHGAPALVWDAAIAKRAQGHASKCKWGHSSERSATAHAACFSFKHHALGVR